VSRITTVLAILIVSAVNCPVQAENWPEFRGPTGHGIYRGKTAPLTWSATSNIAWKRALPGQGWSSPVIWEGRVYLTAAVPVGDGGDQSLRALALDAAGGDIVWQTEVFRQDGATAPKIHSKASHANPTPLTDGKRLYVHFGHQGTAALDLTGKVLWRNTELRYAPVHGNGGSPILVDDRLVYSCDGGDRQFVVALECATGKIAWKTDRRCTYFKKFSFSTPLLIEADGRRQIVSPGSGAIVAYDPAGGKELWRAQYEGYSVIPRPVFGHGLIFFSSGYDRPALFAIRADGTGDVTESHVAWITAKGAPHAPSPLLVGDELYTVSDLGVASCFDARTGKLHWQERIDGNFSASPAFAAGRIYLQSEQGVTTVVRAATTFERLSENSLDERTFATPAFADGALYLRTETQLYRIESRAR
jgi:outer membrane protein assembly factor BamB